MIIPEIMSQEKHTDVNQVNAITLCELGLEQLRSEEFVLAEENLQTALDLMDSTESVDRESTASCRIWLGQSLIGQNRFQEAQYHLEQAHVCFVKIYGIYHIETADVAINLGLVFLRLGEYSKAEKLLHESLAVNIEQRGEDHPETAINYHIFAQLLMEQGDLQQSENLFRQVIDVFEKSDKPYRSQLISSCNNLGLLFVKMCKPEEGEPFVQRGLKLINEAYGEDSLKLVEPLNVLGLIEIDKENYSEAATVLKKATDIGTKNLPENDPQMSIVLNNLGLAYHYLEEKNKAIPFYKKSIKIVDEIFGTDSERNVLPLNNLGMIYADREQFPEALVYSERSLAIQEKILGKQHPTLAILFSNLAIIHEGMGQDKSAEKYLTRSFEIFEQTGVLEDAVMVGIQLGENFIKQNKNHDALEIFRKTTDHFDLLFTDSRGIGESSRADIFQRSVYLFDIFIEFLIDHHMTVGTPTLSAAEALRVLSRKQSRIFGEMILESNIKQFSDDHQFQHLQEERERTIERIENLRVNIAIEKSNPVADQTHIAAIFEELSTQEQLKKNIDVELHQKHPRYMELFRPTPTTLEQLQMVLNQGEVILTYATLLENTVLFVISTNKFSHYILPIGKKDLEERIFKVRKPMEKGQFDDLKELDPEDLFFLYRLLIAPCEKVIQSTQAIIVIGDGPLLTLPFGMLLSRFNKDDKETFLTKRALANGENNTPFFHEYNDLAFLNTEFTFSYMPSLSTLTSLRLYPKVKEKPTSRELVAFADPIFISESRQVFNNQQGSEPGKYRLPRLPETSQEVQEIAKIVGGTNDIYLRAEAQDYKAKQTETLAHTRYIIFATHGLLGGGLDLTDDQEESSSKPTLVLTQVGDLHGEDGALTMDDVIEHMDLNAELVVLSACNTAGRTDNALNGEGFSGFVRAFMYAGAKSLIVSHWNVESRSTAELMPNMFQYIMNGSSIQQALSLARIELIKKPIDMFSEVRGFVTVDEEPEDQNHLESGTYLSRSHPYFWAPFVYVGC
jgi:CHAT domain-containing protein/tetratricopeptide (TPR) repeat protein